MEVRIILQKIIPMQMQKILLRIAVIDAEV